MPTRRFTRIYEDKQKTPKIVVRGAVENQLNKVYEATGLYRRYKIDKIGLERP